jgi:cellulose synthase/poly-beta-1,6-N-acetylglucosamine synthase-like glycosyltransferase
MHVQSWALAGLFFFGAIFFYPFAIFPALLLLFRRPPAVPRPLCDEELPEATLIVCALNEERVIRAKVENTLALDYPRQKLRMVFISDGSTDGTADVLREFAGSGIQVIAREQRRGKVANLNEAVPAAGTAIVVLSDANVFYDGQALRRLVAHFASPEVGGVCGKVALVETAEDFRSAEQNYYSLEWTIQEACSSLYSMAGTDGAMFAIRRELYTVCPPDTLIEDFIVALGVVRQGKRMLMEPAATAWEAGPATLREEFRRKVRIAAGAAQGLLRGNAWPVGAPPVFWLLWTSHKLLRWLAPVTGLAALACAVAAWPAWPASVLLAGFGLLVVLAALHRVSGGKHPLLSAPFYFLFGQAAVLLGLWKGVLGSQSVLWTKANR